MENTKSEKLFGKYNDIIILIIGFILTTVGGVIISSNYSQKSWEFQYNNELLEKERNRAEEIFTQISLLMDKRLYKSRQLNWASNETERLALQKEYKEMLSIWNGSLNQNLVLLERYFGVDSLKYFQNNIMKKFNKVSKDILKKNKNVDSLSSLLNDVNLNISYLNLRMVWAIQENNIGLYNDNSILKKNIGQTPTKRLKIKQFFEYN